MANKLEPPYLSQSFDAFMRGEVPLYQLKKFVEVEKDDLLAEKKAKAIAKAFYDTLIQGIIK